MRLFVPLETKDAGIEEERLLCPGEIEWKLAQPAADADAGHELDCKVSGYGAVFNNEDLGGDIILPGAFKRSLSEWTKRKSMPAMLWQHMSDQVIGAWDDIAEDDRGLKVSGTIFGDVPQGMAASTLIKRKAVRGLSIGYRTLDCDTNSKTGVRSIKEAELWEISPVTFPMNRKAGITQVKTEFQLPDDRTLEKIYRDGGLSQREAVIAVAVTKKMVSRDGGTKEQPNRDGAGELLKATRRAAALFAQGTSK